MVSRPLSNDATRHLQPCSKHYKFFTKRQDRLNFTEDSVVDEQDSRAVDELVAGKLPELDELLAKRERD